LKVKKPDALHDSPGVYVETGDDPFGEHDVRSLAKANWDRNVRVPKAGDH
jgi:hypothetical protein